MSAPFRWTRAVIVGLLASGLTARPSAAQAEESHTGGWFALGLGAGSMRPGLGGSLAKPGACLDVGVGGTVSGSVRIGGSLHLCGSTEVLVQPSAFFVVERAPRSTGLSFGGGLGVIHVDEFLDEYPDNSTDLALELGIGYVLAAQRSFSLEVYTRANIGFVKLKDSYGSLGSTRRPLSRQLVAGLKAVWW